MPVSIVTRIGKGAPLTAIEHDQNLTNLKNATDANTLAITGRITEADFDAAFEGEDVDGKKQIDWDNVLNVPDSARIPSGVIYPFAGSTIPSGYLQCSGQAVSRTTYADLFAVLGTVYGAGDGSTTFNVPDTRGRGLLGAGTGDATGATPKTLGQKIGSEVSVIASAGLVKTQTPFAWARWSNSGGLEGSFNVQSVAYNAGEPIVTLTNAAPDTTYAVVACGARTLTSEMQVYCFNKTTTTFTLSGSYGSGDDPIAYFDVVVFSVDGSTYANGQVLPDLVINHIIKT